MASMDYNISQLIQNGSTTVAVIDFRIGTITTEDELILPEGTTGAVTRYRRTGFGGTVTVEKSGTLSKAEMIPFLNTELATRATLLSTPGLELTPIESQTNE